MSALEPFAPRWVDQALVLDLGEGALGIGAESLRVGEEEVPREAVRHVRIVDVVEQGSMRRGRRKALEIAVDAPTMARTSQQVPMLEDGAFPRPGLRVPIQGEPGTRFELVRVLERWRDDPELREVWGTPRAEALLVPRFDAALLERFDGVATVDGVELPCFAPAHWLARVGCLAMLAWPVLLVGIGLMIWSGSALGSGLLLVAMVAVLAGAWSVARVLAPTTHGMLQVGQHHLKLAGGTMIRFDAMESVRAARGGVVITANGRRHRVFGVRGDAVELAAALEGLRALPPSEIPAEVERLRRSVARVAEPMGPH